jgi:hypothetical protein
MHTESGCVCTVGCSVLHTHTHTQIEATLPVFHCVYAPSHSQGARHNEF